MRLSDKIGSLVAGRYRLKKMLGRGGMGTVYEAVHEWTGRHVAIKVLNTDYTSDPEVVRRFLQEARAAATLKHPNVVDVLDMGQDDDSSVYLALELLDGKPLSDMIKDLGRLTVEQVINIAVPILDALQYAHSHGIVHRDIKPDNIVVTYDSKNNPVPKLLDFGIAKVLDGKTTAMTETGLVVGTPHYMSPEQARADKKIGPTTDVWSMGVVMFECLTGKLPFNGRSSAGILVSLLMKEAPSVSRYAPAVPPAIASVIDRALSPYTTTTKKPSYATREPRYDHVYDFLGALAQAAESEGVEVPRHELLDALATTGPGEIPDDDDDTFSGPTLVRRMELDDGLDTETPFASSSARRAVKRTRTRNRVLAAGALVCLVGVAALFTQTWSSDTSQSRAAASESSEASWKPTEATVETHMPLSDGDDAGSDAGSDAGAKDAKAKAPDAGAVVRPTQRLRRTPVKRTRKLTKSKQREETEAVNTGSRDTAPERGTNDALIIR